MLNIAELVENVLWEKGWSHGKAVGPNGECCALRASWIALGRLGQDFTEPSLERHPTATAWLKALNKAACMLFPERIDSEIELAPGGQISDHPDTTRYDITRLLWVAQGVYISE